MLLLLEAIDVMLELTDGAPLDFSAGQPPILLRFTTDGARIGLFAVLHASSVRRILDGALPVPAFDGSERVVVMLDSAAPPDGFAVPGKCFYAKRQEGGCHRFYIQES